MELFQNLWKKEKFQLLLEEKPINYEILFSFLYIYINDQWLSLHHRYEKNKHNTLINTLEIFIQQNKINLDIFGVGFNIELLP